MKVVINIFCWITAIFCICFPFAYFDKDMDIKEVSVSHILVDTQEEALNLKADIEKGQNFEKLAREHSKCDSKNYSGFLGYSERGRYVPEFEKVAYKLKKGELSEPVKTSYGWHVIKVNDVRYYSEKENFKQKNKLEI